MGFVFVFHAALEPETFIPVPHAVFACDWWSSAPVGVCHASRNYLSTKRSNRVSRKARASVNFNLMEVPHFRFSASTHHCTSPLRQHEIAFQNDRGIESRCQSYAVAGCVDFLQNFTHMSIGSDHYWDIVRRMHKDLSQRTAAV